MPTIDELSPRTVREKKLDVQLAPNDTAPRARSPVTLLVSYDRTLPAGVMLPILFEVQGPSASSYQRREFLKHKPTTVIFTPREGGRHHVTVREVGHNLWWGSLAFEVAGDELRAEPLRAKLPPAVLPAALPNEPPPPPPPAGPTTTPSWIAVGVADTTGTSSAAPAYGSNNAGDLFVMVVGGRISAFTTPSGWTLQAGPNELGGRRCYILTRDARSSGAESGTVAVTLTANSQISTIHTFRDVATSSFVEDPSTDGLSSGNSGVLPPDITAGGVHRLAVFAAGGGTAVVLADDITGETGGTWVLRDEDTSGTGSDSAYGLYTAALSAGGTIAGGAGVVDVEEHSSVGFALVGT
jgi:hypothetical protein